MKKFLSLVLALVMTMSLVTVSAGAKDFTDSSKITYSEAVDVMSAVKVIDGYAEGDFRPTNTLTVTRDMVITRASTRERNFFMGFPP